MAVLLSGCTTTGTPQAVTPTPTAGAQPTATGTATPATPAGVTTEDGVTTITGSGDQTVTVNTVEGGYLLRYRYKNDLEITHKASSGMSVPLFSSAGAAMGSDGYYTMSRVEHWYSDDTETIEIKANGPYIIEMIQLPHGTAAPAPQTYTGAGWRAVGPFNLNAGQATIDVTIPDLGTAYAAAITLDDGTTGNFVSTLEIGTNTVDVPETGAYYVEVNTNKAKNWEVKITQ
ncbi:hypothetical protein [Methanocella sp. MCL-LM]|uniref:hypothetical protein n=1 Tax=Methanocella sp. MCL-LM TaxID=3412035 RepID=UPI003C729F9B